MAANHDVIENSGLNLAKHIVRQRKDLKGAVELAKLTVAGAEGRQQIDHEGAGDREIPDPAGVGEVLRQVWRQQRNALPEVAGRPA